MRKSAIFLFDLLFGYPCIWMCADKSGTEKPEDLMFAGVDRGSTSAPIQYADPHFT